MKFKHQTKKALKLKFQGFFYGNIPSLHSKKVNIKS
jgi:hypothetical protein